jgi:hypothetical protein
MEAVTTTWPPLSSSFREAVTTTTVWELSDNTSYQQTCMIHQQIITSVM